MNLVKSLSISGLLLMLTACGSSQPGYPMSTGVYPQYYNGQNYNPYNQGTYNYNYGGGEAVYANGQLVGYKTRTPLVNASGEVYQYMASNYTIQSPVSVNAGEKIVLDLSHSNYEVYRTQCWTIFTITSNLRKNYPIPGAQMFLNGQPIASGTVAPTSGTLSFKPNLSPLSADCSILSYGVYLNNAVYKESCTSTNGQPIACP